MGRGASEGGAPAQKKNSFYRGLYRGPLAESDSKRKQSHIVLEAA